MSGPVLLSAERLTVRVDGGPVLLHDLSFELRAGDTAQQRIIKIRLAAYQAPKEQT